jgi:purine nucleosidase
MVLHSGMPIALIPWDITSEVRLTQADVDRLLRIPSPITSFIADATRFYIEFHLQHFGFAACSINDPAALALVYAPDLARTVPLYVDVEIASETTMGKTVGDFLRVTGRPPNVRAVVEFDNQRFIELFLERMEALANANGKR